MDNRSDDRIEGWRRYERDLKGHLRPLGPPPPPVTSVPPRRAGGVLILALLIVFIVAGLAVTFYLERSPDSSIAELFGNKPVAFQASERSGPAADRPAVPPADVGQAGHGGADGAAANRAGESAGGERPLAGTNLNLDPQMLAAPGSNERPADRWRPTTPPEPTAQVPAAAPSGTGKDGDGGDNTAREDTAGNAGPAPADETPAVTASETDSTAAVGDAGDGADKTAKEVAAPDTPTTDVASSETSTTGAASPATSSATKEPVASAEGIGGAGAAAEGAAGSKAAEGGGGERTSAPPAEEAPAEPRSFADIVRAALGGDTEKPAAPTKAPPERAQPPAADRAATREPVALDGAVTRAQLTTNVRDREPIDRLGSVVDLPPGGGTLYFFTELNGFGGRTVTHNWFYGGTSVQSVDLRIGSDRWRTYTKKRIDPNAMGAWKVVMTDQSGRVLARQEFEVR